MGSWGSVTREDEEGFFQRISLLQVSEVNALRVSKMSVCSHNIYFSALVAICTFMGSVLVWVVKLLPAVRSVVVD